MRVKMIQIVISAIGTNSKGLERGLEQIEIRRNIVRIGQNTEKNLGDPKRFVLTQRFSGRRPVNASRKNLQKVK